MSSDILQAKKSIYTFRTFKDLENFKQTIKGKIKKVGDCENWTGTLSHGYIPLHSSLKCSKEKINLLKFFCEIYFPEYEDKDYDIIRTCDNVACVAKDHLKIKNNKLFNFNEVRQKLLDNSVKGEITEGLEEPCLLWSLGKDKDGYGIVSIYGTGYRAHMLALFVKEKITEMPLDTNGKRMITRHLCKNKNCCEISHVILGNNYENSQDMKKDGTLLIAEKNPASTITKEIAEHIKLSKKDKGDIEYKTQPERAKMFNTTINVIASIDIGYTWINNSEDEEKKKLRNEERRKLRAENKEKGLSKKELDFLKEKIYKNSKVQELKDDSYNGIACRYWQGTLVDGYGTIVYKAVAYAVHRIICEWKYGKIEGMLTCHKCNNKLCVEEEHLKWGDGKDNMKDMIKAGTSKGFKLNMEKAREIRESFKKDSSTENRIKLAEKYGVSKTTIGSVLRSETWIEEE